MCSSDLFQSEVAIAVEPENRYFKILTISTLLYRVREISSQGTSAGLVTFFEMTKHRFLSLETLSFYKFGCEVKFFHIYISIFSGPQRLLPTISPYPETSLLRALPAPSRSGHKSPSFVLSVAAFNSRTTCCPTLKINVSPPQCSGQSLLSNTLVSGFSASSLLDVGILLFDVPLSPVVKEIEGYYHAAHTCHFGESLDDRRASW